ncbi:MAG: D-xylose transport system ATP-binding protein [Chloroflexota bacterium]|nr:D-xylose transport system ATP-binding protein [Chloroflexota bacterium]
MSNDIILDIRNVTKEFPGVVALDQVSIQIRRGEIHGICGENGAGKSTLMMILKGVYPWGSYDGQILYEGQELKLENRSIRQSSEKGIAIVYQELTLVPYMTVGENVFLGREPRTKTGINWNQLVADTQQILDKYHLDIHANELVKNLGVGKMQMTEIAKALSEDAKILILDEPTSALSEEETERLMEILRVLKSHGVTCIYITHKLSELFEITDSVTVLRDGRVITTQPTDQLNEEMLIGHMVGRKMRERFPKGKRKPGKKIFEVRGLRALDPEDSSHEVVRDVTFDLREGEILGIAGLMGSGRTELVSTLFGEYGKIQSGEVLLDDKQIEVSSANHSMKNGISLVPEDRKKFGLILIQTIQKNISLANLDQFSKWYKIDFMAENQATSTIAEKLAIKAPSLSVLCQTLSGGNQQKVVIAKWLLSDPRILIMDDPTRGIDVGAKYEIYKLMNELAEKGIAIIMISSEMEEVIGMSDRIMVMCEGKSMATLEKNEFDQERIMALATGC